jgi:hypothetical protein
MNIISVVRGKGLEQHFRGFFMCLDPEMSQVEPLVRTLLVCGKGGG